MTPSFLTSVLDGDEWSVSRHGRFNPGEGTRYPLDRRLGGPHSRYGRNGEDKKSLPYPCRESNHAHPARNLVTIPAITTPADLRPPYVIL